MWSERRRPRGRGAGSIGKLLETLEGRVLMARDIYVDANAPGVGDEGGEIEVGRRSTQMNADLREHGRGARATL